MGWKEFSENLDSIKSELDKLGENSIKTWSKIEINYSDTSSSGDDCALTVEELATLQKVFLYNHASHRKSVDKNTTFILDLSHLPFHKKDVSKDNPMPVSGIELPMLIQTILSFIQNEPLTDEPLKNTSIEKIDLSYWPGNQSILLPGVLKYQWVNSPGISIMQCKEFLENIVNLKEIEMSHSEIIPKIPKEMMPYPNISGMPTQLKTLVWDMGKDEKNTVRSPLSYLNHLCSLIYPENETDNSIETICLAGIVFEVATPLQRETLIELDHEILASAVLELERYCLHSGNNQNKKGPILLKDLLKELDIIAQHSGTAVHFFTSPSSNTNEITDILNRNHVSIEALLSDLLTLNVESKAPLSSFINKVKIATILDTKPDSTEALLSAMDSLAVNIDEDIKSIVMEVQARTSIIDLEITIPELMQNTSGCHIV